MRIFAAAVVCGLATLLVGCQEVKQEFSETLREDATIEKVVYVPQQHGGLRIEPSFGGSGVVGFGPSGVGCRFGQGSSGGVQVTRVTIPRRFEVVFRCRDDRSIVSWKKEVYDKFKGHEGETVEVAYRKIYQTTYDVKDGKKKMVAREQVGYDFRDATFK